MPLPVDQGFSMPAEWAPHSRCWMAWPCREDLWGEGLEVARIAYAEVATAISQFEPVTMLANSGDVAEVSLSCGGSVSILPMDIDDSWVRDNGPTFLTGPEGALAGVAWGFNGWGEKYAPYDKDAALAKNLLEHTEIRRFEAPFVLEGGSITVDGEGTLITTEQCLLNPNRNPGMSKQDIEIQLCGHLGVEKIIWLGEGLEDDETDGHVDNIACFAAPGVVLALVTDDPEDGNRQALSDNLERLRSAKDAKGRSLEVVEVLQPKRRDGEDGRRLGLSYINFYIANGGIVMPAFEDSNDDEALETIERCFPDRKVVQLLALDIVRGGGGIHCITQQQPAGPPEDGEAEDGGAAET